MTTDEKTWNDSFTGGASEVKDKIAGMGRAAAASIDKSREPAADRLDGAATALHDSAENISGAAHAAAGKLNSAAVYVRENDVDSMMADVGQFVRKNPGPSLLVAAVGGFFLGRAFTRND
ncbi:MAG: hypothetical protein ABI693_28180 [Bryobacteraceae bacterium]